MTLRYNYLSKPIQRFVEDCTIRQPNPEANMSNSGGEPGMQWFIHRNRTNILPKCKTLLLHEFAVIEIFTDRGKVDLIYLGHDGKIYVIETKYLNFANTGKTANRRRNKKRNNVENQIIDRCQIISKEYKIKRDNIVGIIVINDRTTIRYLRNQTEFIWKPIRYPVNLFPDFY